MKPIVLILCTGNSCRNQMAGGILRAAAGDILDVESAGSAPAGYVYPLVIKIMKEIGIDISNNRSKSIQEFLGKKLRQLLLFATTQIKKVRCFPSR